MSTPGVVRAEGTIEYPGYHTVQLDEPVELKAGHRFAVVIKQITNGETPRVYVEYPYENYSSKARANADESYVSRNGTTWEDMTSISKNTNCCIKAFTDNGQAQQSPMLFSGIDNSQREYTSDKSYTIDEALSGGLEINPDFVEYVKRKDSAAKLFASDADDETVEATGVIPSPILYGGNTVSFAEGTIFPAKYDLRSLSEVTAVRDQGSWGTCWAHASYASLESCLLKKAKTVAPSISAGASSFGFDVVGTSGQFSFYPTSVSFENDTQTVAVGTSVRLQPSILPEDAMLRSLTWSSDNEAVATVDTNGEVTAHAEGTATITAETVNGCTASCVVVVVQGAAVENVQLKAEAITKTVGDTFLLDYTVRPANASNKNVSWSSSAPEVVSVSKDGVLTAQSIGTAVITVTTLDGSKTDTITVNVNDGADLETSAVQPKLKQYQGTLYGEVTVSVENKTSDSKSVTVLLGVYDANGKLVALRTEEAVFHEGSNQYTLSDLILEEAVGQGYYLKIFFCSANEAATPIAFAPQCSLE